MVKLTFSEEQLNSNVKNFKQVASHVFRDKKIDFFYAVKANPDPVICDLIFRSGFGAEILSTQELSRLNSTNVSILANGHYKSPEFCQALIDRNVAMINAESKEELLHFESLLSRQQEMGLRIKLPHQLKIGMSLDEIKEIAGSKLNWCKITALHFHLGWNCRDNEILTRALAHLTEALKLTRTLDLPIDTVNFGGSFVEPTVDPAQLYQRMKSYAQSLPEWITRVQFEPGRYLVGDCGYIEAHVRRTANSSLFIDTAAYLYKLTGATPKITFPYSRQTQNPCKYRVSGHWPAENDFIDVESENYVQTGDPIIFHNMGAYVNDFLDQISLDEQVKWNFSAKLDRLLRGTSDEESKLVLKYWSFASNQFVSWPSNVNKQKQMTKVLIKHLQQDPTLPTASIDKQLMGYVVDHAQVRRDAKEWGLLTE